MVERTGDNADGGTKVAANGTTGDESGVSGDIEIVTPADAIKSSASGFNVNGTEPFNAAAALGGGERRRRGRPPGSGTAQKKARPVDLNGVEKILLSLHTMAAAAFATPELLLDEAEAKQLATVTKEVADQYAVEIDPKVLAWLHFSFAIGTIYGTRVVAIGIRKKRDKRKPKTDTPDSSVNVGSVTLGFPMPDDATVQ